MVDKKHTRYSEFDALVERHRGLLRSLCWRAAQGDGTLCADLMQETIVQLWHQRQRLRASASEGETREWVKLQCRSVLSHYQRHNKPTVVPLAKAASIPVDAVDHREQLDDLATTLDEQEHRLLQLLMEGYTQVEIAAMWGIHEDSVGRMKRKMIEKMKKNI